jgi:hypothetical protein
MKKIISLVTVLTLSLTGCSASEGEFKKALSDCNVNVGGLKLAQESETSQKGLIEDATPTNDSVSGISGSPTTLFVDVTSVNDKIGLNIVASQCVMQGLGFSDTTINTIWSDQKTMDGVYKAAVAAFKKTTADLKKSQKSLNSIKITNANINSIASKWEREYKSDPNCITGWETEIDEWGDEYETDIPIMEPCNYSDWLFDNKDWEYGDPRKYVSSTSKSASKTSKLETTLAKGVVFPAGKLGNLQPVGQDGFAIAWFYSRKQGLVLGITKN